MKIVNIRKSIQISIISVHSLKYLRYVYTGLGWYEYIKYLFENN